MNTSDPPPSFSFDAELRDFYPEFVAHRKGDLSALRTALTVKDYDLIFRLAHQLRGVGGVYSIPEISLIGEELERAAKSRRTEAIPEVLDRLGSLIAGMENQLAHQSAERRILIADDSPEILLALSRLLVKEGYRVDLAKDGDECLQKVKTFLPDLVILDLMMPRMHGIEVLKVLRREERYRHIGIIVCSARSYKPDQESAFLEGASGYLVKPFSRDAVVEKVRTYFLGLSSVSVAIPAVSEPTEVYVPSVDTDRPYFKIWGCRGSIPVSGERYVRHGGNTPSLQVVSGKDMFIIDAGSGIRELGLHLMPNPPETIHLFIGHTHWDHIQGFPFFTPAYLPNVRIVVYGAVGFGKDLQSVFRGQLDTAYFPVRLQEMSSRIEFVPLAEGPVEIGSLSVSWEYVHHPGAAIGFRFELNKKSIVYITDNEFLQGYLGLPTAEKAGEERLRAYSSLIQFVSSADILITEAQYPNEEYARKIGWGHTSLSNACLLCKIAEARRWIVTHHDPMHDDSFLDRKLVLTRQILREIGYPIEVSHAFDGMTEHL